MLTLLTATKKERPTVDYRIKYLDGMVRAIKAKELAPDDKTITKRIIFYTVKYLSIINIKGMSRESLEGILVFDQMLLNSICELTPAELLTIFPVTKSYDGERYECKDYFSTMEALQAHGLHEPIQSPETASHLLWDYMNQTLMMYRVHCMSVVSEIHTMDTGKGLMEQFFDDQGYDIPVYHKHTGPDGKEYMIGEDGRSFQVKKKIPRYLRPIQ